MKNYFLLVTTSFFSMLAYTNSNPTENALPQELRTDFQQLIANPLVRLSQLKNKDEKRAQENLILQNYHRFSTLIPSKIQKLNNDKEPAHSYSGIVSSVYYNFLADSALSSDFKSRLADQFKNEFETAAEAMKKTE